jgi:hypothetical protein
MGMKVIDNDMVDLLEVAVAESLKTYESKNDGSSLSDLYMRYDEEGKLSFYDDMENLLEEIPWQTDQSLSSGTLQTIFQQLEQKQLFEKEYISKPFTVSWVDDNFVVLDELIFIDDDTLKLDGDLWNTLDKELDDFFKTLLK